MITRSGIIGKIIESGDRKTKLEIAPGVNVMVIKTSIEGLDVEPAEVKKDAPKDGAKDGKEPSKDKPQEKKA